MAMMSNWNSSYLSALLGYQNTQSMVGLAPSQGLIGFENTLSGGGSSSEVSVRTLRNSVLLSHLVQQQQGEERQRILLDQQIAALGGISRNHSALPESHGVLAALVRLQEQEQLNMRQQRLHELHAALMLPGGNLNALSSSSIPSMNSLRESVLSSSAPPPVQTSRITEPFPSSEAGREMVDNPVISILERALGKKNVPIAINHGISVPQGRKRKGRSGAFPQKLHQMLSDLEREGGSDIASFFPYGHAFAIHKPREFANSVMPKYFKMSRFSSFQRQLNLYDFQRIVDGSDKGAYYHDLFLQERPSLCTTMKRNKIKGVKRNIVIHTLDKPGCGESQNDADSGHDIEEEESLDDERM